MSQAKPALRPLVPHFSSGPCAKRPGWSLSALTDALLGRSHRSKIGKAKLKRAIELTREVLEVPGNYRIGIVPASDTGAVEMALWSMLGARPVTMLAWESFGEGWVSDVAKELKLAKVTVLKARYGELPDLSKIDPASDVVFSGGREGFFYALDARNGTMLWKAALGGQIASGPITYRVDGRQYVAVAAGHALFTFALR